MGFSIGLRRSHLPELWSPVGDIRWTDAKFAAVDLETTGLDPRTDAIVSIGVVPIDGAKIRTQNSIYRVIKPPIPISPSSTRIHHLRSQDVVGQECLEDVWDEIAPTLEGRILVAHTTWIERRFLNNMLRKRGFRLPGDMVDTALLAETAGFHEGRGSINLEHLAKSLGVPVHNPHHALGDAMTAAGVMICLAARIERRISRPLQASDLSESSRLMNSGLDRLDMNRTIDRRRR